jgi:hypothetical protein
MTTASTPPTGKLTDFIGARFLHAETPGASWALWEIAEWIAPVLATGAYRVRAHVLASHLHGFNPESRPAPTNLVSDWVTWRIAEASEVRQRCPGYRFTQDDDPNGR